MSYDFTSLKNGLAGCEERLVNELAGIHTGRAIPAILDGVSIDVYGAKTAISHVSAVTGEDARTLRVAPWDKAQIKDIESAINNANLGVSVASDEQGLRVFFPELTTERRESFVKLVKEKLESARICARGEREKTLNEITKQEKDGEISKDEMFGFKDEMQKLVGGAIDSFEGMFNKKEKEILS